MKCVILFLVYLFFFLNTPMEEGKKRCGEKGKILDGALSEQASELLTKENVG